MNYIQQISSIAADLDVVNIKEKFTDASVFEVFGKERSETVHSAFLRWLLNCKGISAQNTQPLELFLQLLAQRGSMEGRMDSNLCSLISSGLLRISNINTETEVLVRKLAAEAATDYALPRKYPREWTEEDHKICRKNKMLNALAQTKEKTGSDRIDLVIDMEIDGCPDVTHLQIILENKIDSREGGAKSTVAIQGYDNLTQTKRYFEATKRNKPGFKQIYVFIDPTPSSELDILNWSEMELKCSSDQYIMICYQDIYDMVILPLIASKSLTDRARIFLEDYRNELTFPSLSQEGQVMAVDAASIDVLLRIWSKNKELISAVIFAVVDLKYYIIDGLITTDVKVAKEQVVKALIPGFGDELIANGWLSNTPQKGYIDLKNGYYLKTSIWFSKLAEYANEKGIVIEEKGSGSYSDDEQSLLVTYWDNNNSFILKLLRTLNYIAWQKTQDVQFRRETDLLLSVLNKRDTTKYYVSLKGTIRNEKPLGKGEAALDVIRCWIELSHHNSLEELRYDFPISCSDYYKHGKWFKHLFYEYKPDYQYEYDGTEVQGVVEGNWDFYHDDQHCLQMSDGSKVVMLKMWRKSTIEGLLKYINEYGQCNVIQLIET